VARDLGSSQTAISPAAAFDLGSSGGSDVARNRNAMVAEAFGCRRPKRGRP